MVKGREGVNGGPRRKAACGGFTALIEYRVQFDPLFAAITYQGVPDIRIVVFLSYPVMAMVRLPTRLSDGKANLHQGAIGAGMGTGPPTGRAPAPGDGSGCRTQP